MDGLAEREREPGRRAAVGLRLEQLAHRDLLAIRVGNLDADRGLSRDAIDEDRLGLHRQAQVVGQPRDLAVLDAGVGFELVRRDDRTGVDLHHVPFDRELAALLLELPGAVHQLPLVDFLFTPGRVEQRERRLRVGAALSIRRFLRRQLLGIRQRQCRLHRRVGRSLDRRRCGPRRGRAKRRSGGADHGGSARGLRRFLHCGGLWRRDLGPCRQGSGLVLPVPVLVPVLVFPRLVEVLLEHFLTLALAATFLAAGAHAVEHGRPPIANHLEQHAEEPAERELRRENDRQEEQRQDQDDRAGLVEVLRQERGQQPTEGATGGDLAVGDPQASEREGQKRRDTAEEETGADELGVGRIGNAAPEVMPPAHDEHHWQQVGRIAEKLIGQLRHEGADAAAEVQRRDVRARREEQDRIRRVVTGERDQPHQRQGEEPDADELADPPGHKGSRHVRSP